MDSSRRIRMIIASDNPTLRARARSAFGSFPARIEMKTMLSMPRTISRTVKVASAIQPSALVIQLKSNTAVPLRRLGRRAAFGNLGERAPGFRVLPDQRGQVHRDVFSWIRRGQRRGGISNLLGRGSLQVVVGNQPVLVGDPERIEEARHHR